MQTTTTVSIQNMVYAISMSPTTDMLRRSCMSVCLFSVLIVCLRVKDGVVDGVAGEDMVLAAAGGVAVGYGSIGAAPWMADLLRDSDGRCVSE